MTDEQRSLALMAAKLTNEATADLVGYAHDDDLDPDTVTRLADATKMAIEITHPASIDEATNQLLGALVRFLEG